MAESIFQEWSPWYFWPQRLLLNLDTSPSKGRTQVPSFWVGRYFGQCPLMKFSRSTVNGRWQVIRILPGRLALASLEPWGDNTVARPWRGRDVPTSSSRLPVQASDVLSSFQDAPTPGSSNHSIRAPTYTMWDSRSMHTRRDGTQLWLFWATKIWARMICYAAVFTQNTKKISHSKKQFQIINVLGEKLG